MSECMYLQNTPLTSYEKGCRCVRCMEGKRIAQRKYESSEKGKKAKRKYEKSDKGKMCDKKYRKSYKGKRAKWKHENSEYGKMMHLSRNAKRRAWLQVALTPEETENIRSIYEECQRISQETGIPHHVDHIIPLAKGGQHHPSNLQILSATENLKKGTKIVL